MTEGVEITMREGTTVAIIAATGATGKWALKGALERGYTVKVLVRSADKLKKLCEGMGVSVENVVIMEGNVTDEAKIRELCEGVSTLISFLGMVNMKEPVVAPAVEVILKVLNSMEKPPKFVSMSSIGVNESKTQANKAWGGLYALVYV